MQFAFSYFYYLRELRMNVTYEEFFAEFDTDGNGVLSDRELRLFVTKTVELPIRLDILTALESEFKKCFGNGTQTGEVIESYYDKEMPQVTSALFTACPYVTDKLDVIQKERRMYKSTELDDSEIEFQMIGSNVSSVIGQLDHIRKNQKKFLCVNDDMDHGGKGKWFMNIGYII